MVFPVIDHSEGYIELVKDMIYHSRKNILLFSV